MGSSSISDLKSLSRQLDNLHESVQNLKFALFGAIKTDGMTERQRELKTERQIEGQRELKLSAQ